MQVHGAGAPGHHPAPTPDQDDGGVKTQNRRERRAVRQRGAALVAIAAAILAPICCAEQDPQTWITTQLYAPLGERSDIGFRARTRFSGLFDERRLYQYQLTAARRLGENLRLEGGYEQFRSRDARLEDRWLGQLILRQPASQGVFRHRLRLEHREFTFLDDRFYRLRYLLGYRPPLGDSRRYVEFRNEVFVSLTERFGIDRGFVQNRIGATLGQRFGKRWRGEFRYQWEYVDRSLSRRRDHLLQFNLIWDGR